MKRGKNNEEFEEDYFPGQLDFYTELFERGPGKGKKRKHPASKLDDVAFMLGPLEWTGEEPEDDDDFSLGSTW